MTAAWYDWPSSSGPVSFWATVCKTVRRVLSVRCLSVCLSVLSILSCLSATLVYCGQMIGWIMVKLGTKVGLGPGPTVLDEDPAPPPQKKGHSPQFSAHVFVCGDQTAGWIKVSLVTEVGLGPGEIVLNGDPVPPPSPCKKGGHSSPHTFWFMYCGQMAGWIKMPLGREVGLGPGVTMLLHILSICNSTVYYAGCYEGSTQCACDVDGGRESAGHVRLSAECDVDMYVYRLSVM